MSSLTKEGCDVLDELVRAALLRERQLTRGLSEAEIRTFIEVLAKLQANVIGVEKQAEQINHQIGRNAKPRILSLSGEGPS